MNLYKVQVKYEAKWSTGWKPRDEWKLVYAVSTGRAIRKVIDRIGKRGNTSNIRVDDIELMETINGETVLEDVLEIVDDVQQRYEARDCGEARNAVVSIVEEIKEHFDIL